MRRSVLIVAVLLFSTGQADAGSVEFKAGVGYDFLSQSFQVDSLVDSLDYLLTESNTYIDDIKGRLTIEYAPGARGSMLLRSSYEQSASETRLRFGLETESNLGFMRITSSSEIDWRHKPDDSSSGSPYWYASSRNRLRFPLGSTTTLKGELRGDMARFSEQSQYRLNYYRYGGKLGIGQTVGEFSTISFGLFANAREVPDSSEWAYVDYGLESDIFWYHDKGDASLYFRLEQKDYNQPGGEDDYTRLELHGRSRLSVSNVFAFKALADFEQVFFEADDNVNSDYQRVGFAFLLGYESLSIGTWIGPSFVWFDEQTGGQATDYEIIGGQSYCEAGARIEVDLQKYAKGFISIENSIGRRTMTDPLPGESDFTYERLSIMADSPILDDLRLSLMFSADWEFHQVETENNRIFLISCGLNWNF